MFCSPFNLGPPGFMPNVTRWNWLRCQGHVISLTVDFRTSIFLTMCFSRFNPTVNIAFVSVTPSANSLSGAKRGLGLVGMI